MPASENNAVLFVIKWVLPIGYGFFTERRASKMQDFDNYNKIVCQCGKYIGMFEILTQKDEMSLAVALHEQISGHREFHWTFGIKDTALKDKMTPEEYEKHLERKWGSRQKPQPSKDSEKEYNIDKEITKLKLRAKGLWSPEVSELEIIELVEEIWKRMKK